MPLFSRSVAFPAVTVGGPNDHVTQTRSWLMRCYERYLQRSHLAELDDHMLRDLGLTREQVAAECRKSFWQ